MGRKPIKVKPLEIMRYWAPILAERYGDCEPPDDPITNWITCVEQGRFGRGFAVRTHFHKRYCFACGPFAGSAKRVCQRSHILAVCDGGTDDVDNLHMLCDKCHSMSEFLSGNEYWQWLDDMNEQPAAWVTSARITEVMAASRALGLL